MKTLLATIPLTIAVLCTGLAQAAGGPSKKQFDAVRSEAMRAARALRWEEAHRLWLGAHEMAPESTSSIYDLACAAARLGRSDEALDWLEKAFQGGYHSPDALRNDPDLKSLQGDSRWTAIIENMQRETDREAIAVRMRRPDPDFQLAPSFKSYRKLAAEFDRRGEDLEDVRWRTSFKDTYDRQNRLRDERIAAVRRYLADHPVAKDREDAAWDAVETRVKSRYPYNLHDAWGEFGLQTIEETDQFLAAYPRSLHLASALTYRAFYGFGSRPEGGTKDRPWRDEEIHRLEAHLSKIAKAFRGTSAGGIALAWALAVADQATIGAPTAEMRAMREEIDRVYGSDRVVQGMASMEARAAIMRVDGLDGFEGSDLTGQRWTSESFRGKVTLVDFWATWCGPCVAEIPTVRKAWLQFQDRGLQIIGVSLDGDERSTFEAWLTANDVAWPQIWDGKGWDTPLAKKFEVRGIPLPVLIDRDGRVAAVDLRGDALLSRIGDLLNHEPAATEGKPTSVP